MPTGGTTTPDGYVRIRRGQKFVRAHREAWEQVHGPVPEGYELHHLCHNPACMNVEHLKLVTRLEHRQLHPREPQTHCQRGHPFDEANTYIDKRGRRSCLTCRREYSRAYMRERRRANRKDR